jgi:hypothetical protein
LPLDQGGDLSPVKSQDGALANNLLADCPIELDSRDTSKQCWDRPRARRPIGEGLPFWPFRLQGRFTSPPWLRFTSPSIHRSSPSFDWVSFPLPPANTTLRGSPFAAAAISFCSGLRVCSPPNRSYRWKFPCRAAEASYIRTERASLPSHASDIISARLQAIGGTRPFISQDSQPCRLLPNRIPAVSRLQATPQMPMNN